MSDQRLRDLGVRIEDGTAMQPFEALVERARRRVAVQRAGGLVAVVALTIVAAVGLAQLVDQGGKTSQPTNQKQRDPGDKDIFTDVHGWIVYGDLFEPDSAFGPVPGDGVWAVDPTGRDDRRIHLTHRPGEEPLGWSSDGTRLLIRRAVPGALEDQDYLHAVVFVVLTRDGTERRLTGRMSFFADGTISPDGSEVVYTSAMDGSGLYTVGTDGGAPRLLLAAVPRHYPGEELHSYPVGLYKPVFSPDGSHIAYFDGMGDWGHSLRVMRSDGTGVRVLIERTDDPGHIDSLAWSPDGKHLVFAGQAGEGGIWIIGVDGSGRRKLISNGVNPVWSPDGTRLAYQPTENDEPLASLVIANAQGRRIAEIADSGAGPWNPLPLHD